MFFKNVLQKIFAMLICMVVLCPLCADQKVTGKLLCNQALQPDAFNLINSFNRCEWCDLKRDIKKFKAIFKKLPAFSFPHSVELAKGMLRDKPLKKYVNRFTLMFLKIFKHYFFMFLDEYDITRFKKTIYYNDLKDRTTTNIKRNHKKPQIMNLEELVFRFFEDYFKQHLDKKETDFMIKMLRQIFEK